MGELNLMDVLNFMGWGPTGRVMKAQAQAAESKAQAEAAQHAAMSQPIGDYVASDLQAQGMHGVNAQHTGYDLQALGVVNPSVNTWGGRKDQDTLVPKQADQIAAHTGLLKDQSAELRQKMDFDSKSTADRLASYGLDNAYKRATTEHTNVATEGEQQRQAYVVPWQVDNTIKEGQAISAGTALTKEKTLTEQTMREPNKAAVEAQTKGAISTSKYHDEAARLMGFNSATDLFKAMSSGMLTPQQSAWADSLLKQYGMPGVPSTQGPLLGDILRKGLEDVQKEKGSKTPSKPAPVQAEPNAGRVLIPGVGMPRLISNPGVQKKEEPGLFTGLITEGLPQETQWSSSLLKGLEKRSPVMQSATPTNSPSMSKELEDLLWKIHYGVLNKADQADKWLKDTMIPKANRKK